MRTITGTVTCNHLTQLPPRAYVEVTLSDVARMDSRAPVLASATFPTPTDSPFAFLLEYDPGTLSERGKYALRVRILVGDRLLFTSTEHIPAFELDPAEPIVLSEVGGHP